MLNQVTVIGRVVEVVEDRDAQIVVIKTGEYKSGAGKLVETMVGCRFWGKATKYVSEMGRGELWKVDAEAKSRKSDKGMWFTSIEARYAQRIEAGGVVGDGTSKGGKPPDDDSEPAF